MKLGKTLSLNSHPAAPHVTGLLACLLSSELKPGKKVLQRWPVAQMKTILRNQFTQEVTNADGSKIKAVFYDGTPHVVPAVTGTQNPAVGNQNPAVGNQNTVVKAQKPLAENQNLVNKVGPTTELSIVQKASGNAPSELIAPLILLTN